MTALCGKCGTEFAGIGELVAHLPCVAVPSEHREPDCRCYPRPWECPLHADPARRSNRVGGPDGYSAPAATGTATERAA